MSWACVFSISARIILPLAPRSTRLTQASMMSARCAALHQIVGQVHHLAEAVIHDRKPPSARNMHRPCGMLFNAVSNWLGQRRLALARHKSPERKSLQIGGDLLEAKKNTALTHAIPM
jgi:hypothetical protein